MELIVDEELRMHCVDIMNQNIDAKGWDEIASCDMFQSANYCGGFESIEDEFCFSHYSKNGNEYWFQFSLIDASKIAKGELTRLQMREAG